MEEASKVWSHGQIDEYLCNVCYDIRNKAVPLKKIPDWEDYMSQSIKVAWLKISLDYPKLINKMLDYYKAWGQKSNISKEVYLEDQFNPLASIVEFTHDYKLFLDKFYKEIEKDNKLSQDKFGWTFECVYKDIPELYCFKVWRGWEVERLISLYIKNIYEFFPDVGNNIPIKLSISLSNINFPFFEQWRYLNAPKEDINLRIPFNREVKGNIEKFKILLNLNDKLKSKGRTKLYKIEQVEKLMENSKLAAEIEMRNDLNNDLVLFIRNNYNYITASDVISYYNVVLNFNK